MNRYNVHAYYCRRMMMIRQRRHIITSTSSSSSNSSSSSSIRRTNNKNSRSLLLLLLNNNNSIVTITTSLSSSSSSLSASFTTITRQQQQQQGSRRQPLPPLPRILPTTTVIRANKEETTASFVRQSWENGNILLLIGFTGIGFVLIDRYLQYQASMNEYDINQYIKTIQYETKIKRLELYNNNYNKPTLYRAKIKTMYKNMGGSYGLTNVRRNDIIDVIEENVGPEHYYHLCRTYCVDDDTTTTNENGDEKKTKKIKSIGWYPVPFLQKIETNETEGEMVRKSNHDSNTSSGTTRTTTTTTTASSWWKRLLRWN